MTIRDFNEQCRIGTVVYKGRRPLKIIDINRREHTAMFHKVGWIRCSELFLLRSEHREWNAPFKRGRAVVQVIDGEIVGEYVSVSEAAATNGYTFRNTVDRQCRANLLEKKRKKTFPFYYRDDPKIKHLLR